MFNTEKRKTSMSNYLKLFSSSHAAFQGFKAPPLERSHFIVVLFEITTGKELGLVC